MLGRGFLYISGAGIGAVRPFQLDSVVTRLFGFPGTGVAYFAVVLM